MGAKQRQLRLAAFAEASKLPLQTPRTKVAMITRAYRKPPSKTWCPVPESTWGKSAPQDLQQLEVLLHYFQVTCKPAVAAMDSQLKAALHANVACAAAEAFITCKSQSALQKTLVAATTRFYRDIMKFAASQNIDLPPTPKRWMNFVDTAAEAETAVAKPDDGSQHKKLLPRVIAFDLETGLPQTQQESRENSQLRDEDIALPWREWHKSAAGQDLDLYGSDGGAVAVILRALHAKGRVDQAPVDVTCTSLSKKVRVRANRDLKKGQLELPPCVPKAGKAHSSSSHPSRVVISVSTKERDLDSEQKPKAKAKANAAAPVPQLRQEAPAMCRKYYLHPEYKMPEDVTDAPAAASAVAEAGSSARLWKWNGDETMHPFWAVQRMSDADLKKRNRSAEEKGEPKARFNTHLVEEEFAVVTVGTAGKNSIGVTVMINVPFITNSEDITKGDELLVEIEAKPEGVKRKQSWKDDAVADVKQKAKPKPSPQAKQHRQKKSLEIKIAEV